MTSDVRIRIPVMFHNNTQTFDDRASLTRHSRARHKPQGSDQKTRGHFKYFHVYRDSTARPRHFRMVLTLGRGAGRTSDEIFDGLLSFTTEILVANSMGIVISPGTQKYFASRDSSVQKHSCDNPPDFSLNTGVLDGVIDPESTSVAMNAAAMRLEEGM